MKCVSKCSLRSVRERNSALQTMQWKFACSSTVNNIEYSDELCRLLLSKVIKFTFNFYELAVQHHESIHVYVLSLNTFISLIRRLLYANFRDSKKVIALLSVLSNLQNVKSKQLIVLSRLGRARCIQYSIFKI